MAKVGKMKKKCERYKLSGSKSINKAEKQKRHLRRLERFAQRKEEGKSYTYVKKEKPTVNISRKTAFAVGTSIMAKLANPLDEKKKLKKIYKKGA